MKSRLNEEEVFEKDATSFNDCFDAFRLSMIFWHLRFRSLLRKSAASLEENHMSMVDEGNRNKVSMKDLDPSYGTKDSKEQALDRIENNPIEVNKNLREIITLLTAIKNKRIGRTISV